MKIDIDKCKTPAQAVTKICYNESTRSLDYKIGCENMEDLKECVKIIDQYNDFDWRIINLGLEEYASIKRYYSPDNPNNGSNLLEFDIGREGSPVMYIKLFDISIGETKTIDKDGNVKEYDKKMFEKAMKTLGKLAKADECDCSSDGCYYTYRLWWD